MRGLAMTMGAVFLIFTLVQFNDPDSLLWIGLYGYAVLVSVFADGGRAKKLAAIGLVVYLAYFLWLSPALFEDFHWLRSERAREALGLAIAAVWMAVVVTRYTAPTEA